MSKDKCFKLHIHKKKKEQNECDAKLLAHGNVIKEVNNIRYLGDVISSLGNFDENILARENKAIGIKSQIMSLLNNISLGFYFFQIEFVLPLEVV